MTDNGVEKNKNKKKIIDDELSALAKAGLLDKSLITAYLIEDRGTKNDPVTVFNLSIDSNVVDAIRLAAKSYIDDIQELIEEIKNNNTHTKRLDEKNDGGGGEEVVSDEEKKSIIPEYNPDHSQILFQIKKETITPETFSSLSAYLSGIQSSKTFNSDTIKENKLKAWVFRFEYDEDNMIKHMYFFQKFQASKMLGAKKISIFQEGDEFKLVGKPLLTMNDEMDFLLYEDTFVVTKMVAFEKVFGYEAFYKENATDLVKNLKKETFPGLDYQVKFKSDKSLKSMMNKIQTSTRIAHKLYSAKKNGYFKKIKFDKLEELNNNYGFGLALNPATKEWEIKEDSNLSVVSQILNDDYGISQLTELEYLALMKELIN